MIVLPFLELTVNIEEDSLGDRGGDVVGCDAEVGAHLMALDLAHAQGGPAVHRHWK